MAPGPRLRRHDRSGENGADVKGYDATEGATAAPLLHGANGSTSAETWRDAGAVARKIGGRLQFFSGGVAR
eukprot:1185388-Prorocentrum_minimum.AAC.1